MLKIIIKIDLIFNLLYSNADGKQNRIEPPLSVPYTIGFNANFNCGWITRMVKIDCVWLILTK